MKSFNCGKCKAPFNVDLEKVAGSKILVVCKGCGAKNLINVNKQKLPPSPLAASKINNPAPSPKKVMLFATLDFQGTLLRKGLVLGPNIIGRKDMPTDSFLSAKHCEVKIRTNNKKLLVEIVDLKSTNGTFDFNKNKLIPMQSNIVKLNLNYYLGRTKLRIHP